MGGAVNDTSAQVVESRRPVIALAGSVILISALHYVTSFNSMEWHELFQRLYYVPIIIGSVLYGMRGGLAVAGFSAFLFLPHVVLKWHAWPALQVGQYAEILVFVLVAFVTGLLADRLRAQRDRCQRTAVDLEETCRRLEASIEERLRADRLVTIGRLASGIAHEIRTPLGGLLGSLEIIGSDIPRGDRKAEFVAIARGQIDRLNRVVTEFLDFAHPPAPTTQPADLTTIVQAAVRLASPVVSLHGGSVDVDLPDPIPLVEVDADQVERALLNLLLDETTASRTVRIRLGSDRPRRVGRITVTIGLATGAVPRSLGDLFEPFPGSDPGAGLTLAMARRLIENQRGTIRADLTPGNLHYLIEVPLSAEQDRYGAEPLPSASVGPTVRARDAAANPRPADL